jgi:iron(III) transport system permease protein
VTLPWALPGTVLAVALASTFSVHRPLTGQFVLVGTFAILPLAYFVRNIPLVTRAALGSFRPARPRAGGSRRLARRLPGHRAAPRRAAARDAGDRGGALLAFVTALGEFVASILLYTHRTRPIAVEMLSQLRAFDFGGAAAYGVLLIALVALVFAFGYRGVSEDPGS